MQVCDWCMPFILRPTLRHCIDESLTVWKVFDIEHTIGHLGICEHIVDITKVCCEQKYLMI